MHLQGLTCSCSCSLCVAAVAALQHNTHYSACLLLRHKAVASVLCCAAVRFSAKVGFAFATSESGDSFSGSFAGTYKGWGVEVSAAASFARSSTFSQTGATLTATRDFLPIGFQVR